MVTLPDVMDFDLYALFISPHCVSLVASAEFSRTARQAFVLREELRCAAFSQFLLAAAVMILISETNVKMS